jgi:hypothetical protein
LTASGFGTLFVPVLVSLQVQIDAQGRLLSLTGDTPNEATLSSAESWLRGLIERGQLHDPARDAAGATSRSTTHVVITDSLGRRVVRRQLISHAS